MFPCLVVRVSVSRGPCFRVSAPSRGPCFRVSWSVFPCFWSVFPCFWAPPSLPPPWTPRSGQDAYFPLKSLVVGVPNGFQCHRPLEVAFRLRRCDSSALGSFRKASSRLPSMIAQERPRAPTSAAAPRLFFLKIRRDWGFGRVSMASAPLASQSIQIAPLPGAGRFSGTLRAALDKNRPLCISAKILAPAATAKILGPEILALGLRV